MNPSSISHFRAKAHVYLYRLDVSFVQNRFTLPNIAYEGVASAEISLSSANLRLSSNLLLSVSGPKPVLLLESIYLLKQGNNRGS
jgi:hypothetical protein